MIEFKARLLVDTQDPERAYKLMRDALQFAGFDIKIADTWLVNHEPLPKDTAQQIALAWQRNRDPLTVDYRVQFVTDTPAVMVELMQMDLFAQPNEMRNLAYLRAGDDSDLLRRSLACDDNEAHDALDRIGENSE